jgi:EAL domain-containing protein (putative c-di-GMP-specific phosphodiesterase class I)
MIDVIRRLRPESRVVVATGYASELIERAAAAHEVEAFLTKPFDHAQLLTALGLEETPSTGPSRVIRVPTIDEMLDVCSSTAAFQPIMSIADGATIHGFEALALLHPHWPLGTTVSLFEYAATKNRLFDLNFACIRGALGVGAALAKQTRLFINVDPPVLSSRQFVSTLRKTAAICGVPLDRIVIELTENGACPDEEAAVKAATDLKADGVEFAFDDVGSAHSHMSLIERLRPKYLKISHTFGIDFEKSSSNTRIIGNIMSLAEQFGCEVILEGVETAESLTTARGLSIRYAQGYFFSRPCRVADAMKILNPGEPVKHTNWD